ncbi:hypothetical protein MMC31_000999 [Peltigera leucophlebia]|nr:hypothetical protein [Peltigera leucophlebia]
MAHSGEWTGSSKTAQALSIDFECIEDVKNASNWSHEMLLLYLERMSNEVEEQGKELREAVKILREFE